MKYVPAALALGVILLVAVSSPAQATCTNPRLFSSGLSYIYTPGVEPGRAQASVTDDFSGSFWALGFGDPRAGSGTDNGTFPAVAGFYPGRPTWVLIYPGYPATMVGTWAASALIDGCIDAAVTTEGPGCMAISFADQHDGQGYFAVLSDAPNSLINYDFEQPEDEHIVLAPVPEPSIRETVLLGVGAIDVLIDPPAPTAGFYLDPQCDDEPAVLVGYRIYSRKLLVGSMPPVDRSSDSGWQAVSDVVSLNGGVTVQLSCGDEADIYLAQALVFDSGFETPYLSGNAGVIPCRQCSDGTDSDGDGFCDASAGLPPVDCDDTDPYVFPGAFEICDGVRNDCDDPAWPLVPADEIDADADGSPACSREVVVTIPADCDDSDGSVGPLVPETCNGVDDNCDGVVDEDADGRDTDRDGLANACDNCVFHSNPGQADSDADGIGDACDSCLDLDADGFGNPGHRSCPAGPGTDCDDLDRHVMPGAPEVYDGRDNDCDGSIDEGLDGDGDGIPNFRDRCPSTPQGLPVTPEGCLVKGRARLPVTTDTDEGLSGISTLSPK